MPHLVRISLKHSPPTGSGYPLSVPQIRTLPHLELTTAVTLFVGENGSGKSTLLEGIAVAAELPAVGSAEVSSDDTLVPARRLGASLRFAWSPRSRKGFFLRAEDFFGYHKTQARIDARDLREKMESLGVAVSALETGSAIHPDERGAASFVSNYDSRSHGESFMDIFTTRVRPGGLYLLDEPEAALSPRRQIAFLNLVIRAGRAGAQFIMATHSPILLACPGARLYSLDTNPISEVHYESLDHVRVMREFLNDRARFFEP